jgi:hypothetical protein
MCAGGFLNILASLLLRKSFLKFDLLVASMNIYLLILKVITVNLFKEFVAAYRKPPVTLELVLEPACGPEMSYRKPPRTYPFTLIFLASNESWTLGKNNQWQRGKPVQKL